MSEPPIFYKNPAVAVILSFFFMGLGQLYNGQVGWGVVCMILYFISIMLMFAFIGFLTTPLLWIAGMFDAHQQANLINRKLAEEAGKRSEGTAPSVRATADSKKCPQCAEEVKVEAVVCRFCGHRFQSPASAPVERSQPAVPPASAPRPVEPKDPARFFQRPPTPPSGPAT